MICYHGTTKKGLEAILENSGFKPNNPWNVCDNDGAMYIWPQNKLEESYGCEDEEQMICRAFESAQIQAVTTDENEIFTIVLDIPDSLLEDDYSCENMSDSASYIAMNDFDINMIKSIKSFKLNKWDAPFVIAGLLSNNHFNTYSIDEDLLSVAQAVADSETYHEPTEFYDYNEYSIKGA